MQLHLFAPKKNKRPNREQKILHQEIIRRERHIHELKEQNELLLKTTIRQSRTITELKEKIKQLHEQPNETNRK